MSATAATCPKSMQDEVAEVMRCLRETLREPAFAITLALLVTGERYGEENEIAECLGSGVSAANGEGR